ncbi:J domain-containing protein [Paraflavitalea speifideaquila]|uniref:J domain-containing protein n=1 Tax=Paraflavitalea speifideaquila TaxID=3076558 RepID=UPI0028F170AA|nr:J domain-containing protein [Paraflavitalea speifideiaquila]
MNYTKDYYTILGVGEKATTEQLRAAYRQLAHKCHPDKNPDDPSAEEKFKEINEAYKVLCNEITRQIYDSYREEKKSQAPKANHAKNAGHAFAHEPVTKTKTRTYTVTREKRVYVCGTIEVKFQGEPELANSYGWKWEQQFTIYPTEVLATLTSSNIYKNAPPAAYQSGYAATDLFATPLKLPISCRVQTGDQTEYFDLDLYDMRVKDPILKDITKHEESSFGTLEGQLFAYVLYQYDETLTEEYTEKAGATGQVETKVESGNVFLRQQFYAPAGRTMWTEWKRKPGYQSKSQSTASSTHSDLSWLAWLIILIVLIAIWPPLFLSY